MIRLTSKKLLMAGFGIFRLMANLYSSRLIIKLRSSFVMLPASCEDDN